MLGGSYIDVVEGARVIDLNADLGEGEGEDAERLDDALLAVVTSANIACGGHAGDASTMRRTAEVALANGVTIGAHPSYVDREGFGRRVIPMEPADITDIVSRQIADLQAAADSAGAAVRYVKPHGALANVAARDRVVAEAILDAVVATDPTLAVLAISGTELEHAAAGRGVTAFSEIFADRGYQTNGQLVPRSEPGAMIEDPARAVERLLGFLESGEMPAVDGGTVALDVHSICVHGDTPGAVEIAASIRQQLVANGVTVAAFLTS